MAVRHSMADYLRSQGFEMEDDHNNISLHEALLNVEDGNGDLDEVDLGSNIPPKKAFHGQIRMKSDTSDSADTEDSTEFDDDVYYMYQQFDRHNTADETNFVPFQDHDFLSPAKPTSKAIIFLIHAFDLAFGSFLIARGLMQMRGEYGNLIVSLILGVLLLSSSLAGITFHTPLSNGVENRTLTILNVSFGFISFGVYYVLSFLLLTSMATMTSFVGTELKLASQFALCIAGFSLSIGEVYRIMYIQYHYYNRDRAVDENANEVAETTDDADAEDVENANAIPSILFV